ncbi:MAG TPA: phasin family protein [Stellaceae bacterium]|nr:phasin family protein [Stellaceae bacterium]
MSQSAETSTPRSPPTPAFGLDYGPAVEIGQRALDQWTRGMFAYTHELGQFAVGRFNQDFEMWKALVNCTNVGELLNCHYEFAQKAAADYATEASKLIELMTNCATNAFATGAPERRTQPGEASAWRLMPAPAAPSPAAAEGAPRHAPSRVRQAPAAKTAADRDS